MRLLIFVIACHLFWFARSAKHSYPLEVNSNATSTLSEAVLQAISNTFDINARTINLIFANRVRSYSTQDFGDELQWKLRNVKEIPFRIVTASKFVPPKYLKRKVLVLVIEDFSGFSKILRKLKDSFKFNGLMLITLTNGEIQEIQDIFILLWKRQIFNVNVVFEKSDGIIAVKTFMPFNVNNCNDTKPIIINEFKNGNFLNGLNEFFPDKMTNLFGCSVRVSVCNHLKPYIVVTKSENGEYQVDGGRDFKLINLLSKHLNFSIDYAYIGQIGYFFENGSASGILKGLLNNESDLTLCSWLLKANRLKFFDATTAYDSEPITFIIPPGKAFTNFEKLIYPFDKLLWILIITSFIIGVFAIFIIKRHSTDTQNFVFGTGIKSPYLNMFIGFIGGTQVVLPKRNFARFLLMIFLMHSLVMRTLYQGSFYKLMQSSKHHKEIDSIEELVEKDFKFYVYQGLTDMLQNLEGMKDRFTLSPFIHTIES